MRFIYNTNLLTSSADSAMKNPCVLQSILTVGLGLIAMLHEEPSSPRTSMAINSSLSLMKQILQIYEVIPINNKGFQSQRHN